MYTSKQHTSIIVVSNEHHNILVKSLRLVTGISVEVLFTGLNVVQQFTSDFIHGNLSRTQHKIDTAIHVLMIVDLLL